MLRPDGIYPSGALFFWTPHAGYFPLDFRLAAAHLKAFRSVSRGGPSLSVRAEAATFAPSIASRTAIASPMPRLAPVTSATLPFISLGAGMVQFRVPG